MDNKLCKRCGEVDRFPSGTCKPCRKLYIDHLCLTPCKICGVIDKNSSGACKPCQKLMSHNGIVKLCKKCGATDRNPSGACRPCKTETSKMLVVSNKPCGKCGATDKYPTGGCRPCDKENRKTKKDRKLPCRNCGGIDRAPSGDCRPCKLKKLYGITAEEIEVLLLNQNNICAICDEDISNKFCVDHNHATGKIRGLLCHPCNTALGLLRDNPKIIFTAAEYVENDGTFGRLAVETSFPTLRNC